MKLSHEKVVHLSHVLCEALEGAPGVRFRPERNDVRLAILRLLKRELQWEEEIERKVIARIESLQRNIPQGSPEWEIMYRKYYDDETDKYRSLRE
ncbi:MAG: DUF507 family protein [Acidobacteriota bacterium]